MRYNAPDWDRIVDAIAASVGVVLGCHINPDGDSLGGLLGMSLGLRKLGKKTWATWGTSPVQIPYSYAFLPGQDALVDPSELPDQAELFVALDCGSADRLGDAEALARRASRLINIDHHPGNTNFGHLNLVVTGASSTAELVTYLLLDLGIELDRGIATCLYTGVVTDTGRFQYTNSSPETLRLAADLLSYGVPAPDIARDVFESSPFMYLKLVGRVLERARLEEEERFVYSWIDQADLVDAGISMSETEKLVDLVRSTRDADVVAMFKEQQDGKYRVSLRSKGPSVGSIARANGGGGHELAAGFTADSISAGVEAILDGLKRSARGAREAQRSARGAREAEEQR